MILLVDGDMTLVMDNAISMDVVNFGKYEEGKKNPSTWGIRIDFKGQDWARTILPPKNTKKSAVAMRDFINGEIRRYCRNDQSYIIDLGNYEEA